MRGRQLVVRIAFGVGGAVCLLSALVGLLLMLWGVLVATEPLDAFASQPEKGFGPPMDWNEVLEAAAATVMYAGVAGLLAVGSLALLTRSFRSRWLDSRRWWLLPPSLCAITALGVGAALLINRDNARIRADCDEYRFTREAWESDRVADRLQAADGIARCNAFAGLHEGGVDNRLGPPDERARDDSGRRFLSFDVALDRQDGYEYPYSLVVRFDEGRVVEVEFP